jgi:hypothetical protein
MMAELSMTDWKALAIARGLEADDRVTVPLEKLEAQFAALRAQIRLETEPAAFPVLPLPEESK